MDRVVEAFEQWWAKQGFLPYAIPHIVGLAAWEAAFAAGIKHEQMAKECNMTFPMRVKITWRPDEDDDWHDYTILEFDSEMRMVRLRGEADDNGDPFDGMIFWAHLSDIRFIQEVEKAK